MRQRERRRTHPLKITKGAAPPLHTKKGCPPATGPAFRGGKFETGPKNRMVGECAHHNDQKTLASFAVPPLYCCPTLDFIGRRARDAALRDRVQRKDAGKRGGRLRLGR